MDNRAFLSGNDDDENFAALDSMVPHSFNNYGQQQNPVPHTNAPTSSFGSNDVGRIGDGREQGFSGVSESLFDRIRARTAEQQKQSSQPPSSSAPHPFQQQHPSEPTMELEKDENASQKKNVFDAAVAGAASGATQPPPSETTYSFSGPPDFSSAVPHVPTYGPSRNAHHYVSLDPNQQPYPSSIQDKASGALNSLWAGAQTFMTSAQDRMKGGASGGRGYNTNFLLREDGLEGGAGARPPVSSGPQTAANQTSEGGALLAVSGQAYSMLSYGKTFCEDMSSFFMQLPNWGKVVVLVVFILLVKFLFFT